MGYSYSTSLPSPINGVGTTYFSVFAPDYHNCVVCAHYISRGSFLERQLVDEDTFAFKQDDKRAKIEFYVPLVVYLFAFLVRPTTAIYLRIISNSPRP